MSLHPYCFLTTSSFQSTSEIRLEFGKLLHCLASSWQDAENVETDLIMELANRCVTERVDISYSLAERSALANSDLITVLNTESWRDMRCEVLVSLLVTRVLGDEVEVLAANDQSTVHLGRDNSTCKDTTADRDETSERALLVYMSTYQYLSMLFLCRY